MSMQACVHAGLPMPTGLTLAPGDSFSTTVTQTLSISVTNVATWTAGYAGAEQIDAAALPIQAATAAAVRIPDGDDDQDEDTIPDNLEPADDPDGDNAPNFLDDDSDGDGISDQAEAGPDPTHPRDSDSDGIPDFLDISSSIFLPVVQQH